MERFIKEYANYKKNEIKKNALMLEEFKNKGLARIDKILAMREKGLITIDEAMKNLLEIFNN